MNARQRDKYCDYIKCSHRVYNKEITADNPFYEIIEEELIPYLKRADGEPS